MEQTDTFVLILASISAAFAMTPIVTILNKVSIQKANGKYRTYTEALFDCIKKLLHPIDFILSYQFKWIFFVYVCTYLSSNLSEKIHFLTFFSPSNNKLLISFLGNAISGIYKDKTLAQKLGNKQQRPFPILSIILFIIRDIICMAAAFTVPPHLAIYLEHFFGINSHDSLRLAQILSPLILFCVCTLFNLIGNDLYNRQQASISSRIELLKQNFLPMCMLWAGGFSIAYGVGGNVNLSVKQYFSSS